MFTTITAKCHPIMEFVDYSLVSKNEIERACFCRCLPNLSQHQIEITPDLAACMNWVCFNDFGISASFTFYLVQQKYTEEQRQDNPVSHFLFLKKKKKKKCFALQTAKRQQLH